MLRFLIIVLLSIQVFGQEFKVEKISGSVKAQQGSKENFITLKKGDIVKSDYIIFTDKKSTIELTGKDVRIKVKEKTVLPVSGIKKISKNDFILGLTMEEVRSNPDKGKIKSGNTAVYGKKVASKALFLDSEDAGIKRLNGAIQIAEQGFKESAVLYSKEIYRKYPETKQLTQFRFYFADIIKENGLSEEAYNEYTEIKKLELTDNERIKVDENLKELKKKL